MIRSDDLHFAIYCRHGDSCNCIPGQCASGYHPQDYVLTAKHAYFQEAIDVAQAWAKRGVNCRIKSTAVKPNTWHEYPAQKPEPAAPLPLPYVLVTVSGGVADIGIQTTGVEVDILDFDDIEADYERAAEELSADQVLYIHAHDADTYAKLEPFLKVVNGQQADV